MFDTFILKVANRCNINCDYCYVFNSADLIAHDLPARMSLDVARVAVDRIAAYAAERQMASAQIVLHGGEPLLLGLSRMGEVLRLIDDRLRPAVPVTCTVQTNGTLLSESWLDLFEHHGASVGVSLDGPPTANDRHRLTFRRTSTADAVAQGLSRLRARPHLFAGLLAVIDLANDPAEVFDHLCSFDPPTVDLALPHANHSAPPPGHPAGGPGELDHDDAPYGRWLCRLYDHWLGSGRVDVVVRMFDDIIGLSLGARGSVEALGLAECGSITVESDGSIETIDALRSTAVGETVLGLDVFASTFAEVEAHPRITRRRQGKEALSATCRRCALVDVCGGGYLPHRFDLATGYDNPSVYCGDLSYLISHVQRSLVNVGIETTIDVPVLTSHPHNRRPREARR